jgi:amino acid adenylation domain-containing protein
MDRRLEQFLGKLSRLNIRLRVDGDRLVCTAPKDVLTAELQEEVGRRKMQILALLGTHASDLPHSSSLVRRPPNAGPALASFGQERLWLLQQLNPGSFGYNIPGAIRLHGPLQVESLESALSEIVRRHEILRTTLSLRDGILLQVVNAPFRIRLQRSHIDSTATDQRLENAITSLAQQRIDLNEFPYWRFSLIELGEEDHVLAIVQHHIVSDGWSMGIIFDELSKLYGAFVHGQDSPLPELPIQYSDYAAWQRERLQGDTLESLLSWWKQHLQGLPANLVLPLDTRRPDLQSDRGDWELISLAGSHVRRLKEFCGRHGVTPFMTLLSVFAVLLSRYSGQDDVVIGTPTGNRDHQDCEQLLGFFLNTLAIRIDLQDSPSFEKLVRQVRGRALECFAHQELPFEKLVDELQLERDLSRPPLFQVMFIMHTQPTGALDLHDLTIGHVPFESGSSKYDLTLAATLGDEELLLTLEYCTSLFESTSVRRMLRHVQGLLSSALEHPDVPIRTLPMMSDDEQNRIVKQWNQTDKSYPQDCSIDDLVFDQARETPDRIAVCDRDTHWSYQNLTERVEAIQRQLIGSGLSRGEKIAVYLDRSVETVATLLAVLRCGLAYIPLDDALPEKRLRYIIDDSNVAAILTQESRREQLTKLGVRVVCIDSDLTQASKGSIPEPRESFATAEDVAYIIYTSGSTGMPKGVAVPHRPVVNFLCSMASEPGITQEDRLLALTSLTFDISVLEMLLPLTVGAAVVVGSLELAMDGRAIAKELDDERITIMQATPTSWTMLIRSGWKGRAELKALCGGEPMSRHLAQDLLHRVTELWNLYGPTETTIWSSTYRISSATSTPTLGRPIANTTLYCLDQQYEPTPIGVPGELYIGGDGLAVGYEGKFGLTAGAFLPNPFSSQQGARMYRTGDLVRFRGNGQLQFLGRVDRQVKVRGHRIELEEVEHILTSQPTILSAAVDVETGSAGSQLVAWIVPVGKSSLTVEQLRTQLSEHMPAYMVPNMIVVVDSLPTTPSGKMDRKKLPRPTERPELKQAYVNPSNVFEERIANIWRRTLRIDRIGMHDNFFDLGGHSLLLASVREELQEEEGHEIRMVDLFRFPTIGSLARFLNSRVQVPLKRAT